MYFRTYDSTFSDVPCKLCSTSQCSLFLHYYSVSILLSDCNQFVNQEPIPDGDSFSSFPRLPFNLFAHSKIHFETKLQYLNRSGFAIAYVFCTFSIGRHVEYIRSRLGLRVNALVTPSLLSLSFERFTEHLSIFVDVRTRIILYKSSIFRRIIPLFGAKQSSEEYFSNLNGWWTHE